MALEADPDKQTELDEPIKFQWQGRLAGRVCERQLDYAGKWDSDDETWSEDEDADPLPRLTFRVLTRHKTVVEIRTAEEAQALHETMSYYSNGAGKHGITWMNGAMQESARRVMRKTREGLDERGYSLERSERGSVIGVKQRDG